MEKRINWVKMDQIKALYEKDLDNFREKYELYKHSLLEQENLKDLKTLEGALKKSLSVLNNYKSFTIHNIEKNGYVVSKTLLFYFDEKDKEIEFLQGEYNSLLSKIYSKINLVSKREKDLKDKQKKEVEDDNLFQSSNIPCSNITTKEKTRRFFKGVSLFRYRYLQFAFWIIIIVLFFSVVGVLVDLAKESNDKISNFGNTITTNIMGE